MPDSRSSPRTVTVMDDTSSSVGTRLLVPLLGLLIPLFALGGMEAVALAAGRVLAVIGASLVLAALLTPSASTPTSDPRDSDRRRTALLQYGSALVLAGVVGEGVSRLVARPLSFGAAPVAFAIGVSVFGFLFSLRGARGLVAGCSFGGLGLLAASVIATGIEAGIIASALSFSLLPAIGGGVLIARLLGEVSTRSVVLLAGAVLFGLFGLLRTWAFLRIDESYTATAGRALLFAALASVLTLALLGLPAGALRRDSGLLFAALPLTVSILAASGLALLPLERDRAEGLARAVPVVEADLSQVDGMTESVGAGPRDEFRGKNFDYCDRINSRDCFITIYDDIALRDGVAAAVSDLVDKVKTNQGATFPAHCHQVVHNLGQMAFMLADRFGDAAVIDPQVCGTGYTHGLWEQQFTIIGTEPMFERPGSLCKELNMVSDWYKWTCHHILGHMMAAALVADPTRAVEYCNDVEDPQGFTDCQTGGWMNFFQDDTVIAKMRAQGSFEDLFGVCWGASASTKFFCYQELFPVVYSMVDGDDFAAGQACITYAEPSRGSGLPWTVAAQNFTDRCIQGLARGIGASSAQNPVLMRDRCLTMPEVAHDPCLTATAASYVLNTGGANVAFNICKAVTDDAYREYCYFWTKHARKLLANGPNSSNLPGEDEIRLPEIAGYAPGSSIDELFGVTTTVPGN